MVNGEKGRMPSFDEVLRAVLPAEMPMHPDHPMQQVVDLKVAATVRVVRNPDPNGCIQVISVFESSEPLLDGTELVRKSDAMRVIEQLQADNLALRRAAEVSAADANDAERKLQQRHEAHRKTWRQTEQLAGLVREILSALPTRRDWLDPVLEARMKAVISLQSADSEPQAVTFAGIKVVEDASVPDDCIRVIIAPDASVDDIPDFIAGNGNKARRRMQALGIARWVPVPVDSEGGHCD